MMMMLSPPLRVAFFWCVQFYVLCEYVFKPTEWGNEVDRMGTPKWRDAVVLPSQLFVFPTLLLYSLLSNENSFRDAWKGKRSRQFGLGLYQKTYAYIFALFALSDFVIYPELKTVLKVHHFVVFAGNLLSMSIWKDGFPLYFAGAVALEIGSASVNFAMIFPESHMMRVVYAIVMTLSNIVAGLFTCRWCTIKTIPRIARGAWFVIVLALLALRERAMVNGLFYSKW